jgi:hypothetical protein
VYPETRTNSGVILAYIVMTFDFTIPGEVRVTMHNNCVNDIISDSGVTKTKVFFFVVTRQTIEMSVPGHDHINDPGQDL